MRVLSPHGVARRTGVTASAGRCAVSLALALGALVGGCGAPANPGAPRFSEDGDAGIRVHVVRHGGHSGFVLRVADIPDPAWPLRREFANAEHVEVGWGDRAYYQARDPSLWLGVRALLWPTAGVLHVAAFEGPVERHFPASEVVALQLAPDGFARMVASLSASHELDAAGRPIPLGPGLYGTSRFYASRQPFHLFATCNVWTATMLREAGVPVSPALSPTAGALFAQLRRYGQSVRRAPR